MYGALVRLAVVIYYQMLQGTWRIQKLDDIWLKYVHTCLLNYTLHT